MRGLRALRSRAAAAERRLADAERALNATECQFAAASDRLARAREDCDDLRRYLALIIDGAGGEVTIPARSIVASPCWAALAVSRDLDGNVILSTR